MVNLYASSKKSLLKKEKKNDLIPHLKLLVFLNNLAVSCVLESDKEIKRADGPAEQRNEAEFIQKGEIMLASILPTLEAVNRSSKDLIFSICNNRANVL